MPFLLPILLGVMLFLILKYVAVMSTITAVVISGIAVVVFVGIWQGALYLLKKSGHYISNSKQTYKQVESNLKQMVGDLQGIRSQLAEVEPHLQNLEFLKYAPQNSEVEKSET
jgi:Na+/H+-translocating membrane pyrophosphatase